MSSKKKPSVHYDRDNCVVMVLRCTDETEAIKLAREELIDELDYPNEQAVDTLTFTAEAGWFRINPIDPISQENVGYKFWIMREHGPDWKPAGRHYGITPGFKIEWRGGVA